MDLDLVLVGLQVADHQQPPLLQRGPLADQNRVQGQDQVGLFGLLEGSLVEGMVPFHG